jgi:hypothetical protein
VFPLQTAYAERYEKSLEQAVVSETSGKFKRVLLLAGCDSIAEVGALGFMVYGLGFRVEARFYAVVQYRR